MLSGHRDGAGDGQGNWAARPDGPIEDLVNAPQIGASERGQAIVDNIAQRIALIHAPHTHGAAFIGVGWHLTRSVAYAIPATGGKSEDKSVADTLFWSFLMGGQALTIRGPFHGPTGYDHHVRETAKALHELGVAPRTGAAQRTWSQGSGNL